MITLTADAVRNLAYGYLQALYPTRAVTKYSFLGHKAEALAQMVDLLQQEIADVQKDSIPAYDAADGVPKSRCSTEALDEWAYTFALPSNMGAGRYGRNGAQAGKGGLGSIVGPAGTIIASGSTLTDPTGKIVIRLAATVTIGISGSVEGGFDAVTAGAASNLPTGTKLYWSSPPAGVASTVTLYKAIEDGYDAEGDLALLMRLLRQIQSPITGGTASDFRQWAESATDTDGTSLGFNRIYVFKKRNGLGSVDVVPTVSGSGQLRDPGADKASKLQAFLDSKRVVCDTVRVVRPYFPPSQKLSVLIRVNGAPGYGYDFANNLTFAAGSTTTVVKFVTGLAALAIIAAVTAGKQPRIQFSIPSVRPAPYEFRATAAADVAGITTVTLNGTLPLAPAAGTTAWPSGGLVMPVALGVLAYIDSIGPSNQSKTADRITDDWVDAVYISAIGQAVLDTVDAGGTRVAENLPSIGVGSGVTVAVGAGVPAASDVVMYDNVPGQGPQLPEVVSIIVVAP